MDKETDFDLHFELRERGIVWQVVGFAVVGVVVTSVLAVYSGSDKLPFRFLDVATSKLSWAFAPTFAFALDWSRAMFKRASDIRRDARLEAREKARQKGIEEGRKEGIEEGRKEGVRIAERRSDERFRELLNSDGVVVPPEVAERVFGDEVGKGQRGVSLSRLRFARWFRKTTK